MSVPAGGSTPADNPGPASGSRTVWPENSPASDGAVPVLSRVAHDRGHLSRSLPDPTGGRPVRVLTVDGKRTVPVAEGPAGPELIWDEQPELPLGAVYLGEADGVPYAAVRGERALSVNGRPIDSWAGLREVGADLSDLDAGLASTLSALIGAGLPAEWLAEHQRALGAVTVEEVQEVSRRYLAAEALTAIVVGDAARIAEPLQALAPVSVSEDQGTA